MFNSLKHILYYYTIKENKNQCIIYKGVKNYGFNSKTGVKS